MELVNGNEAEGKVCITDYDDKVFGCLISCYFTEENSGSMLKEEGENFLASVTVYGDPNLKDFRIEDYSDLGYGKIAIEADLVGSIEVVDDKIIIKNPEDTQKVVIEHLEGADLYDDIADKKAQDLANQYQKASLDEIAPPEDGRYYMDACEITYTTDKNVNRVCRIYGISTSSNQKVCIDYDVEEGQEDWVNAVCDDLFWSLKLD